MDLKHLRAYFRLRVCTVQPVGGTTLHTCTFTEGLRTLTICVMELKQFQEKKEKQKIPKPKHQCRQDKSTRLQHE